MPLGVVMIFQVAKAKGYHIKDPLVLETWDTEAELDYIKQRYEVCIYTEACLLQRWLSTSKGIIVLVGVPPQIANVLTLKYSWKRLTCEGCEYCSKSYDTYDEALLDGVKQALKILK